jgi:hypothetical protein
LDEEYSVLIRVRRWVASTKRTRTKLKAVCVRKLALKEDAGEGLT